MPPLYKAIALALIGACTWSASGSAQEYPTQPVRLIVPYPAGGTADAMARILGDHLSRKWHEAVVVENRSGAGGNLGAEFVAASPADGHTLLVTPQAPLVINQYLYADLRFDPSALVPIVVLGQVPTALLAHPKLPFNNIEQLIDFAAANPGKLKAATQGIGTTSHITSEMFQMMVNVKLQQVPYRGSAPALQDLVAGNVDMMFDNIGASLSLVRDGKLKLMAVATKKRMTSLPYVATIAETLPDFASTSRNAIAAARHSESDRQHDQLRCQRGLARAYRGQPLCRVFD